MQNGRTTFYFKAGQLLSLLRLLIVFIFTLFNANSFFGKQDVFGDSRVIRILYKCNVNSYPDKTPRMRFITKNAPNTTNDTKYAHCHVAPIAS